MSQGFLYTFTGNPFVDAGIWAICEWSGRKKPEEITVEDLREIKQDVISVYLSPEWAKSLYSVFPNNAVTNPSVKNKDKRLLEFLEQLIGQVESQGGLGEFGNCISCGRYDVEDVRTKTEIPLIGSGTLINFFPYGQQGADYCAACTLAVQFSPFIFYACGKLLLIHSNSNKVMHYWAEKAIKDVRRQISANSYRGCFDEGYKNPVNALFHIIEDLILQYEERWIEENPSISMYHFTNYNQGPDLEIYRVPTPVFRFLAYVKHQDKFSEWIKIVRKGYFNFEQIKEGDEYKNKGNSVYINLLKGHSIVKYFIDNKARQVYGDWQLLEYYLTEVRNMGGKRLDTLKKVGDSISDYIKDTQNIKKLNQLEMASNFVTFRNLLRLIEKDRIKKGSQNSLFTLEEFMEDLFPEGNMGWKETQDLLLFRIYENLHNWLVGQDALKSELISSEEEETELSEEE
ncbi:CRISPR-associated protein [Methanosarcina sp. 2.H.T.1A.6]|nr:CRISPR-associated protein [Methanosarcina sp. 2.H.T.1A.3]KKG16352.1 CRISPR-associated protein [Methanosarcina sp. 2.H.T.1A.15]KKG21475.1 CRISPR-associated protein [Methanosarcina sp. 2.H.T.1A.8]KKG21967.1 CRISPR-associated protein [Methanosarcina sp. 2.H.T.1A.6]